MKFTKFLCFVLPVLCCILCSACSTVNMGIIIYNDGSIVQSYEISLDNAELQKIGINTNELLQKIDQLTQTQWNNASNGKDLTNITFEVQKTDFQRMIIIKFGSFDDYARFYEIDTSTPTEENIKRTLFYNRKMIRDSKSNYTTIATTNVYNEIHSFLLTNYFDNNEEEMMKYAKNITASTSFIYPTSLKTKSNATIKQQTGNYDIHIWQNSLENEMNGKSQNIEIWNTFYTTENRLAWYLSAVIATIIFGIILFVVFLIKNKPQKTPPTTQKPEEENKFVLPPKIQAIYNGETEEKPEKEN